MVTLNTCYTLQFYTGLQADTKPLGVPNGSMFLVMDTGKLYRFDAENQTWIDQANPTPSGGNDMFVVTLSFDGDETYTTDKTYAEITAALEDGQIPVMVYAEVNQTSIFYCIGTFGGDTDVVVFSTMPDISAGGVAAFNVVVTENDSVSYSQKAYPGE